MKSLVGFTGFVGSNISAKTDFDGLYNSKNIADAYGTKPDLLVFAGLPAEKFLAAKFPEKDMEKVQEAIENIKKIAPKQIVLISTIDVYPNPVNVDEDTVPTETDSSVYGYHRLLLEKFVENYSSDNLVVRLPGLYGKGIKKNFIYDMIHVIPSLLNDAKYKELSVSSELIRNNYALDDSGFYKCQAKGAENLLKLKNEFERLKFTALNFTDSRGVFQYYNLACLWGDIQIALAHNVKKLNIATEPIRMDELYQYVCGEEFCNEIQGKIIPHYDFKSKYFGLYGGKNGYLYDKNTVLSSIKSFVKDSKDEVFHI